MTPCPGLRRRWKITRGIPTPSSLVELQTRTGGNAVLASVGGTDQNLCEAETLPDRHVLLAMGYVAQKRGAFNSLWDLPVC